jgi:hypothetical protein
MTTLARTAVLPFDHLAAELVAFPLCSESTIADPITHLDPAMTGATARLWRAAERELIGSAPGISLDELAAMRDDYWFGELHGIRASRPRSLRQHLAAAAGRHLTVLGGAFGPRLPSPILGPLTPAPAHAQARRAWMWLTFALPGDLLLAAASRDGQVAEPDLISPPVRDLLSRGFAETHLHVGASFDFPTVWSMLMARIGAPGVRIDAFTAPGAAMAEGADLASWLVRAAMARWAIARLVAAGAPGPFATFLHQTLRPELCRRIGPVNFSLVASALDDLQRGRLTDLPLPALCGAYTELIGPTGLLALATLPQLQNVDPLGTVLPAGPGGPEQRYVQLTTSRLARTDGTPSADPTLAVLFWQTVRLRVLFYRYLTQRPLTPGLPWFIRFYDRMAKVRGSVCSTTMLASAAATSGASSGLTSLEVRTSPYSSRQELMSWTAALNCASESGALDRGIVFHFLKERGELAPGVTGVGGAGTHADPAAVRNGGRFRYSYYLHKRTVEAETLAQLLYRWPRTLDVVRGLDVCSDELAVPAWVVRPLLARVRAAAQAGARGHPELQPLRTTVHAGEDYAHLLTGLRHVHEAIEVLDLREGDRIGHGLALGVDPGRWAARSGRAALPLQDRVFDLAWEWTWWTRRGGGSDAARLAYLLHEIAELTDRWFGERAVDIRQVVRLRSGLADPLQLAAVGFPDRPRETPPSGSPHELLHRYLSDPDVFRRGMTTVLVDPANEVDAMTRIGISLRAEVARRGLAIEINPTSNLLIGDLTDLDGHPLWRLSPPRPRPDLPPLSVTVGSDDPLVFNCTLPREYQLLYDSLLLAGLTDSETMRWLDGVRRTGLERRFTLGWTSNILEPESRGELQAER